MLNCSEKESRTTTKTLVTSFIPRQLLITCKTDSSVMTPKTQKTPSSLTDEQRLILLQSIAHFIQQNGFSKTLKRFLKEASIQKDSLESCSLDMVDMYSQYQKMRNDVKEAINEQDAEGKGPTSEITKENVGIEEKKSNAVLEKEDVDTGKSKSNKKKKKSKTGDTSSEQVLVETQSKPSNTEDNVSVPSEPAKKSKEEKKKHKGEPEHVNEAVQESQSKGAAKAPEKADDVERKEKKKKKDKIKSKKVKEDATNPISSSLGTAEAEKENKGSKKRKLSSEEDGAGPDEETVVNDSKRRKTDNSDQCNGVVQPPKTPEVAANGLLKNGGNHSQKRDKTTERNGSAEPKTVNAFQRVKPEDVEFLDERLQDNSYWAKDGADSGYGAKAQEVLGQVRGRGFRHEKTKKKRGTYRGGQIDLQTHSVKFSYNDDDE